MKSKVVNLGRIAVLVILLVLSSCNQNTQTPSVDVGTQPLPSETPAEFIQPSATPTTVIPRSLTICMANEPGTLFLYGSASSSSRAVWEAIYDGPVDIVGFTQQPVILENIPSTENGGVRFENVLLYPGDLLVGADNQLTNLAEGVAFFPAGCESSGCAQVYAGSDPVEISQTIVNFRIRDGVTWQDGAPVTAHDSIFAYQLAQNLFPDVLPDLVRHTHSYHSTDLKSVEWRGIPGFLYSQTAEFFFRPLPKHVLEMIPLGEIFNAEIASRKPLAYGAYRIEEWIPGERINLVPNPSYFRTGEGLPFFDHLVFRFIMDGEQALQGLMDGECDLLDESYNLDALSPKLAELAAAGEISIYVNEGTAWEQISMGQMPATGEGSLLQNRELRRAISACIDRQSIVDRLFNGQIQVAESYMLPGHPYSQPQSGAIIFDPLSAGIALDGLGWRDDDSDPNTPRTSVGIAGIPEQTPLIFSYLVSDDNQSLETAGIVQQSLVQCGVGLDVVSLPANQLFASGPDGPLFGRQFQFAQFSWSTALEPPCGFYLESEIPGPYPVFPKGWGGANAVGYVNPDYDRVCVQALRSEYGTETHASAHRAAWERLIEDAVVVPLFFHPQALVSRPDFCGLRLDPSTRQSLWNIEAFAFVDGCP